jgi:hypothetical protein
MLLSLACVDVLRRPPRPSWLVHLLHGMTTRSTGSSTLGAACALRLACAQQTRLRSGAWTQLVVTTTAQRLAPHGGRRSALPHAHFGLAPCCPVAHWRRIPLPWCSLSGASGGEVDAVHAQHAQHACRAVRAAETLMRDTEIRTHSHWTLCP